MLCELHRVRAYLYYVYYINIIYRLYIIQVVYVHTGISMGLCGCASGSRDVGKSWYSMIPVHVEYRSKRNLFTFGDFGVWRGRVREKREKGEREEREQQNQASIFRFIRHKSVL